MSTSLLVVYGLDHCGGSDAGRMSEEIERALANHITEIGLKTLRRSELMCDEMARLRKAELNL